MPLPPYIASRRAPDEQDRADYQTVFARDEGSVAAPTAGLHFTKAMLARLGEAGANIVCAQPSFRPQTENAMQRLERRAFQRRFFDQAGFRQSEGFRYRHAAASVMYFSAIWAGLPRILTSGPFGS